MEATLGVGLGAGGAGWAAENSMHVNVCATSRTWVESPPPFNYMYSFTLLFFDILIVLYQFFPRSTSLEAEPAWLHPAP